ncbi:ComEC/Rec2 family competence protein [Spiroplasma gladiatoris]|uniref:ComEC/Rec2 family competence protein n=1 Tax=Spiroplasma gladiatoris TaxID=2143 RepID=UPI001067BA46|nr:ComEC/Rec2 family competence protein [Spiroplasma gladiatoris]
MFENSSVYYVDQVRDNYAILSKGLKKFFVWKGDNNFSVGEVISGVGELKTLSINPNFWSFDFNKYLIDKNVTYSLENFKKTNVLFKDIRYFFYSSSNANNNLVNLMLFQLKSSDSVYLNLTKLSLGYLTNISSLYLYPLAYFLNKIFKNKKRFLFWSKPFFILILIFYCYLIGMPPVLLKVVLFFLLNWFTKKYKVQFDRLTKFSIVWIVILFINPFYLYNLGFIYCCVGLLILKRYNLKKESTNILINFLIINLVFLPLNVFFDYKVFWLAQIQEIILTPILFVSFFLMFFYYIPFLNYIFIFNYNLLDYIVAFFVKYNLTTLTGHISIIWVIVYYLCFYILTHYCLFNKKIKFIIYCLLSTSFVGMYCTNSLLNSIDQSIEMLNVGNGNSFILNSNLSTFIFDAGVGTGQNKSTLPDYLRYKGKNKINYVFISHNHADHYNSLNQLKEEARIDKIYQDIKEDMLIEFKDIKIYMFNQAGNKDENDNSQIIVVKYKDQTFLFTGDATKKREIEIVRNPLFLSLVKNGVDFYQVGHHGSKTSTSDEFVKTIKPKVCFISGTKKGKLNFPDVSIIKTLENNGCQNYVTNSIHSYKYKISSKKVVEIKKEFI